ncbi:NAD(P)/FAD-dependent oxidoreductase [Algibacter mikhailovii]|uniref:FAD-dependent oxidoreductase n=1 Tax=Algibacter mikhailovii TaxID=425498 RepID=A0A918V719_9FLAO|nr:FAD-dependent oxidoreductase [Algibacter mikhailovii]GGZ75950.1 FAD-dependent oxidoreductase [Algibacter mikhailovii]
MNLSYWEIKTWFSQVDFCIVGSGIVGLSCALELRKRFPRAKIVILEKGVLPQGASSKNAGFACFGSLSELLDDLKEHSFDDVFNLVKRRSDGLKLLRRTLGDQAINYQQLGGYELFLDKDADLLEDCLSKKEVINNLLNPIFGDSVFSLKSNSFNFKKIKTHYIFNQFEGQIDTGKMIEALLHKVLSNGVKIINSIHVKDFAEMNQSVKVITNINEFSTAKLIIATNGFASQLINVPVRPARAQVLITEPIRDLHIKGTFHLDRGYYYFRNIDNRILLGGGRHLDFTGEQTTVFDQTKKIQEALEALLKTVILPETSFEIAHRWSGIMGVGNQKKAMVKALSNNVYCGVRLGGMGVAIGSSIGQELSNLIE